MLKVIRKIITWLIFIVLILFVAATLYQILLPNHPSIFGYRTFSIASDSMRPILKKGDVIITKENTLYKKDDVITYLSQSGDFSGLIITHQIIEVENNSEKILYHTKGTNNILDDEERVTIDQVYGKYVYKLRFFSIINRILHTKLGFIIVIVLPMIIIYIGDIKNIIESIIHKNDS